MFFTSMMKIALMLGFEGGKLRVVLTLPDKVNSQYIIHLSSWGRVLYSLEEH